MTENRIPRFTLPSLEDLKDLPCDAETREKIRAVLCGEILSADVSEGARRWSNECHHRPDPTGHEIMLAACDDLLGTHGTEGLEIEGDVYHTDEGVRMCPAFSYCNAGDPYTTTLLRDHGESAWLVAGWGDALDEYEQENELGDYTPKEDDEKDDDETGMPEDEVSEASPGPHGRSRCSPTARENSHLRSFPSGVPAGSPSWLALPSGLLRGQPCICVRAYRPGALLSLIFEPPFLPYNITTGLALSRLDSGKTVLNLYPIGGTKDHAGLSDEGLFAVRRVDGASVHARDRFERATQGAAGPD